MNKLLCALFLLVGLSLIMTATTHAATGHTLSKTLNYESGGEYYWDFFTYDWLPVENTYCIFTINGTDVSTDFSRVIIENGYVIGCSLSYRTLLPTIDTIYQNEAEVSVAYWNSTTQTKITYSYPVYRIFYPLAPDTPVTITETQNYAANDEYLYDVFTDGNISNDPANNTCIVTISDFSVSDVYSRLILDANGNIYGCRFSYKRLLSDNLIPEVDFNDATISVTFYDLYTNTKIGHTNTITSQVLSSNPPTNTSNQAPFLFPIGNKIIQENKNLTFSLNATDADNNSVTYSAANLPPGATFDPFTATFSWTPASSQIGIYENIGFTATDDGNPIKLSTELITITVNANQPPVSIMFIPQTIDENNILTFQIQTYDQDGNDINVIASSLPEGSIFTTIDHYGSGGKFIIGKFTWNLTNVQSGNYTVTFTATDDGIPSASSTLDVPITVTEPTPAEKAGIIMDTIENAAIPARVENSYLAILRNLESNITQGRKAAARIQLNIFKLKVNADYLTRSITKAQRDEFLALANDLLADLR